MMTAVKLESAVLFAAAAAVIIVCWLSSGASVWAMSEQQGNRSVVDEWYARPLYIDDIFAGGFLLLFGLFFLPIYAAVAYVMFRNDRDIIGFRFLFSASLADMLLLFNYAVWPGITILNKSEIVTPPMRHWVQIYMDWAWFATCYHYCLVAWSRFAAIRFANSFRTQSRAVSYCICAACYVIAMVQVLSTHFQSWYVTFYYEPSAYGMRAEDFPKYLTGGQSLFFFVFHIAMMIVPVFFYGCAMTLLLQHRRTTGRPLFNSAATLRSAAHSTNGKATAPARPATSPTINHTTLTKPASQGQESSRKTSTLRGSVRGRVGKSAISANTEARLIVPCILNSVVFVIGQIFITIGTGTGKWASWMVLVLFSFNSAMNPILLLTFSAIIRQKTLLLLTIGRYNRSTSTTYGRYNNNSAAPPTMTRQRNSTSPSDRPTASTHVMAREGMQQQFQNQKLLPGRGDFSMQMSETEDGPELPKQLSEPVVADAAEELRIEMSRSRTVTYMKG